MHYHFQSATVFRICSPYFTITLQSGVYCKKLLLKVKNLHQTYSNTATVCFNQSQTISQLSLYHRRHHTYTVNQWSPSSQQQWSISKAFLDDRQSISVKTLVFQFVLFVSCCWRQVNLIQLPCVLGRQLVPILNNFKV